jgi:uncharacterized protein (DUF305 family)
MADAKDYNAADVVFLQNMIPHHEMALPMSAKEIMAGDNVLVKEWATAIFTGQKAEIAKFKAWLKARGLSEKPDKSM